MKMAVTLIIFLTVLSQMPFDAHAEEMTSSQAREAFQKEKPDETTQNLERIKSKLPAERRGAIDKLADAGDPRAVEPLIAALKDQEGDVRASAANALGQL